MNKQIVEFDETIETRFYGRRAFRVSTSIPSFANFGTAVVSRDSCLDVICDADFLVANGDGSAPAPRLHL
ncbi:hypothetical protein [Streptomyces sp. NPDC048489]|uniref:hypothetical protein n=1 Tax=Streptomyces sp. NPDC048489 TaxID=3154504 RepID=UPI003416319A